jgi:signal-transduction protein with cAMP-binding, CBS, and nucleotidyltransferase domain
MNCLDVKNLQRLKNLARVSPERLEKLAHHCTVRTFEKSEIIFDQDEHARWVYLLVAGSSVSLISVSMSGTPLSVYCQRENFSDSIRSSLKNAILSDVKPLKTAV